MALSTYTELKASIADWLVRADLTAAIPDFISLAEAQIERNLRTRQMISRASATISTEYSALPDDFLEVKSLKLQTNPVTPLQFETIDSLDNLQQQYRSASKPRFFSIVGNQIRTVPVPDDSYTTELTYYAKLSKLSSTNTTNWLLTAASDAYLYGTLMQAAPYLKDDARIAVWSSMYISALEDLQVSDDRGASSGGALIARAKTFG
jgi:hypothetical protein